MRRWLTLANVISSCKVEKYVRNVFRTRSLWDARHPRYMPTHTFVFDLSNLLLRKTNPPPPFPTDSGSIRLRLSGAPEVFGQNNTSIHLVKGFLAPVCFGLLSWKQLSHFLFPQSCMTVE